MARVHHIIISEFSTSPKMVELEEAGKEFIAQAVKIMGSVYIAAHLVRGIYDGCAEVAPLGGDGLLCRVIANNVARVSGTLLFLGVVLIISAS